MIDEMTAHPEDYGLISALIPALARAHRARAFELLESLGLAPGQEFVLMLLWAHQPRTQASLTRDMAVEPPTAAKMLARLERAGIVSRQRDEVDRRNVLVTLTERGNALREPVERAWQELEEETVSGLSPDQTEHLAENIRSMTARLLERRGSASGAAAIDVEGRNVS